jgi:hypothetical protein
VGGGKQVGRWRRLETIQQVAGNNGNIEGVIENREKAVIQQGYRQQAVEVISC